MYVMKVASVVRHVLKDNEEFNNLDSVDTQLFFRYLKAYAKYWGYGRLIIGDIESHDCVTTCWSEFRGLNYLDRLDGIKEMCKYYV